MSVMHKPLDPKNDYAFKRIFGAEKNQDILIHFLNDMLVFHDNVQIEKIKFLNPIQDPDISSQKTSIVDVLCEDKDKNKYIIEMQVAPTKGFEKRAQYYAAKAYCSQLNVGEDYQNLKEVVFLAIADYVMFPDKKALKSDHIILDRETHEHDLKDFSFSFLELGKFKKKERDLPTLYNVAEKWCYFFKYVENPDPEFMEALMNRDAILRKAMKELNSFYWSPEELEAYEDAEKKKRDYLSSLEKKFDEGIEKGIEIGIEKGIEKGREEGALQAKYDMARAMMKIGEPFDKIMLYTGLTQQELQTLKHDSH